MSAHYAPDDPVSVAVTALTMLEPSSSTLFQHTSETDHDEAGILITLRWNQRSRWLGNPDHHEPEYARDARALADQAHEFRETFEDHGADDRDVKASFAQLSRRYHDLRDETERYEGRRGRADLRDVTEAYLDVERGMEGYRESHRYAREGVAPYRE